MRKNLQISQLETTFEMNHKCKCCALGLRPKFPEMAGQAQLVSDEFQCQRHHSAGECPHAVKLYFQPQIHDRSTHCRV